MKNPPPGTHLKWTCQIPPDFIVTRVKEFMCLERNYQSWPTAQTMLVECELGSDCRRFTPVNIDDLLLVLDCFNSVDQRKYMRFVR